MLQVGPLLTLPVALHKATSEDEYAFNQVHTADTGRIRYQRHCEICGLEVPWDDVGKGKEIGGQMVVLTDKELESLPVAAEKVIQIDRFVPFEAFDPTALGTSYNVVPDNAALRVYHLIRQQLKARRRVGVGTFILKAGSRDSLAILRGYDQMLVLQRVAWPEDIRVPDFRFLREDIQLTEPERDLAGQLVDAMSGPWQPGNYHSAYNAAVDALIKARLEGMPPPEPPPAAQAAAMQDIGAVLAASIAQMKEQQQQQDGKDAA
jgi:DNA end-binding protein Ku